MKFLKNVDHANVLNGFVQDLSYAVTDYQVLFKSRTWLRGLSDLLDRYPYNRVSTKLPRKLMKIPRTLL